MTICIGVLCSDSSGHPGKAAIVASDRMVTFGGITEFEHEVPKIAPITERIVALMAGDALRGSRVARDVTAQIPVGTPTVRTVAETVANQYAQLRLQQIDSEIFRSRGIDLQQFYHGGLQQRMLQPLVGALEQQVANFNYGVEMLVAGTDDTGAHLYSVLNPGGSVNDFHQIGFHAIGSGMLHALQSIIGFRHTGSKRCTKPFSPYLHQNGGQK